MHVRLRLYLHLQSQKHLVIVSACLLRQRVYDGDRFIADTTYRRDDILIVWCVHAQTFYIFKRTESHKRTVVDVAGSDYDRAVFRFVFLQELYCLLNVLCIEALYVVNQNNPGSK